MGWRKRLSWLVWGRPAITEIRLTLAGWAEQAPTRRLRVWRDHEGDVLSLATLSRSQVLPNPSDETGLRQWSRLLAQGCGAGLIETGSVAAATGTAVSLIYKRLERPAYIYTGMLIVRMPEYSLVWTVVSRERGMTGVREAVITTELMLTTPKLTIEDYLRSWAQDPYDATYAAVDGSVLRFVSDDERYDQRFPQHPLSKVRRVLVTLPGSFVIEPQKGGWRDK
jgi:hypothetical protein